jgi:hypothetical protein
VAENQKSECAHSYAGFAMELSDRTLYEMINGMMPSCPGLPR